MASPGETKPGVPRQPGAARGGARATRLAVVGTGAEPVRQAAGTETAEATIAAAVAEVVGVAAGDAASAAAIENPARAPRPAAADHAPGGAPRAAAAATVTTGAAAVRGAATTLMESTMDQATKATETFMMAAEDAAEFGRGNVEALTKATQAYVTGVQDLGRQTLALMQGLTDHALEGAKALAAVKSVQEAAQIQANYTRAAIEKSVNEGAKLGENALKVAEQSFAPITARVTLAVEKFGRAPSLAA